MRAPAAICAVAIVAALGVEQLKRNPSLVVQTKVPPAFKQADKLARAYGIDRCVRGA